MNSESKILSVPKLLVLELWGIGDLAIATPFLQAASRAFDVTLLAKPHAEPLLKRFCPSVRLVTLDAPWTAFRGKYRLAHWPWRDLNHIRQRLHAEMFDVALSARHDPRDHFLMYLVGANEQVGFPRAGSSILLTNPLTKPAELVHQYELWRIAGDALGLKLPPRNEILPERADSRDGVILVHSGARLPARIWPLERYRGLVHRLRENRLPVQVVCDRDQRDWWLHTGENAVATPSNISELFDLIDRARLFIGNCSGPGHLAAISGLPTFTLFGPSLPQLFAPLHPDAEWIEDTSCPYKPCADYCRFSSPRCLENISEEQVWSRVKTFVARHVNSKETALR